MSSMRHLGDQGFTLIELLLAMAVFSFMLLIIVVGFINIVRIHNSAIASNLTQDSANAGMNAVVNAVRDSAGVVSMTYNTNALGEQYATNLCLYSKGGAQEIIYLKNIAPVGGASQYQLTRADGCAAKNNQVALTSVTVTVPYFYVIQKTSSPGVPNFKPELQITLKVASKSTTSVLTALSGPNVGCRNNNYEREFCSVVTLTSGAISR
jgi:prepilin-type N-terminal cleavage/methylation domain-containing protein